MQKTPNQLKIPIGLIVALILQTGTAIWWLAKLDMKVHAHDDLVEHNNQLIEIVYRLEERVKNLSEELDEFKVQVFSSKCKS
ncbi:MAG: hypothetical protein U0X86_000722 [Wolbachia endosymbiont of Xenopsylla cheopis]